MKDDEKKYIEEIEQVIEGIGNIQRQFVFDKTGISAIIRFIEDLEGRRPFFELDDPVVIKGKSAAARVIDQLETQLDILQEISPPVAWEGVHQRLVESLTLQVEGYQEMWEVFEDSSMDHVQEGQGMVSQGIKILENGSRKE